jgi:N utilization substance protein A
VLVREDQLSLAIGRRGQNVRLASKLSGWDIEIMTQEELEESIDRAVSGYSSLTGVEAELAAKLVEEGFLSYDDLSIIEPDALMQMGSLTEEQAAVIVEQAEARAEEAEAQAAEARRQKREQDRIAEATAEADRQAAEEAAARGETAGETTAEETTSEAAPAADETSGVEASNEGSNGAASPEEGAVEPEAPTTRDAE